MGYAVIMHIHVRGSEQDSPMSWSRYEWTLAWENWWNAGKKDARKWNWITEVQL